jgi:hypothetical protein
MQSLLNLLVITVLAVLSVSVVYIMFKYLKSTATITMKGLHATGAIAGLFLVWRLLFPAYLQLEEGSKKPVAWTISGTVIRQGATNHRGIEVHSTPPPMSTGFSSVQGQYSISDVYTASSEELPSIQFESKESVLKSHQFRWSKDTLALKIDKQNHEIIVKTVTLAPETDQ